MNGRISDPHCAGQPSFVVALVDRVYPEFKLKLGNLKSNNSKLIFHSLKVNLLTLWISDPHCAGQPSFVVALVNRVYPELKLKLGNLKSNNSKLIFQS